MGYGLYRMILDDPRPFQMISTQYVCPQESAIIQTLIDKGNGFRPKYKMDEHLNVDARYIEIGIAGSSEQDKLLKLAMRVKSIIGLGRTNIMIVLKSLLSRSVQSPKYVSNEQTIDPESVQIDNTEPKENIQCLSFGGEQKVYIATHVWQLFVHGHDIIGNTIDISQHGASRNETFILGRPIPEFPQLIDSVQRKPTDQYIINTNMGAMDSDTQEIIGGGDNVSMERNVENPVVVHDEDLERTAFDSRLDKLGYDASYDLQLHLEPRDSMYPYDYVRKIREFNKKRESELSEYRNPKKRKRVP